MDFNEMRRRMADAWTKVTVQGDVAEQGGQSVPSRVEALFAPMRNFVHDHVTNAAFNTIRVIDALSRRASGSLAVARSGVGGRGGKAFVLGVLALGASFLPVTLTPHPAYGQGLSDAKDVIATVAYAYEVGEYQANDNDVTFEDAYRRGSAVVTRVGNAVDGISNREHRLVKANLRTAMTRFNNAGYDVDDAFAYTGAVRTDIPDSGNAGSLDAPDTPPAPGSGRWLITFYNLNTRSEQVFAYTDTEVQQVHCPGHESDLVVTTVDSRNRVSRFAAFSHGMLKSSRSFDKWLENTLISSGLQAEREAEVRRAWATPELQQEDVVEPGYGAPDDKTERMANARVTAPQPTIRQAPAPMEFGGR